MFLSRPRCIVLEIREEFNQLLQQDGDFHPIPGLWGSCLPSGVQDRPHPTVLSFTTPSQNPNRTPKRRPGSAFPWSRAGSCAPPWGEACPGIYPEELRTSVRIGAHPGEQQVSKAEEKPSRAPRPKRPHRADSCHRIARPAPCTPTPESRAAPSLGPVMPEAFRPDKTRMPIPILF